MGMLRKININTRGQETPLWNAPPPWDVFLLLYVFVKIRVSQITFLGLTNSILEQQQLAAALRQVKVGQWHML